MSKSEPAAVLLFNHRDHAIEAASDAAIMNTSSVDEFVEAIKENIESEEAETDDELRRAIAHGVQSLASDADYAAWHFKSTEGFMTQNMENATQAIEQIGYARLGNLCLWSDYITIC